MYQMSVSNKNSGIHAGLMQAHEKCAMKTKQKNKNDFCIDGKKDFITLYDCIRRLTQLLQTKHVLTI